ncbi:11493_t:CDS:2, partial [Scutellospora calospora]
TKFLNKDIQNIANNNSTLKKKQKVNKIVTTKLEDIRNDEDLEFLYSGFESAYNLANCSKSTLLDENNDRPSKRTRNQKKNIDNFSK